MGGLMAAEVPPPAVSPWLYVGCTLLVLLAVFNLWRFRTGWRMTGEHYRPGYTEFAINVGYASLPGLIAMLGMSAALVLFPFAADHQSALLGYGVLLGAAIFAMGLIGFVKEQIRPSRWNRTPRWLEEARARGELD